MSIRKLLIPSEHPGVWFCVQVLIVGDAIRHGWVGFAIFAAFWAGVNFERLFNLTDNKERV